MSQEPIFERIGTRLLEQLREAMVPAVLSAAEDIKLSYPGAEEDYRFGVFLYDVDLVRPYGPPTCVPLTQDTRRNPDLLLALHFLLYANRKVPFDSMSLLDEMILLEAAMRAVYNMGQLEVEGQTVKIEFQPVEQGRKLALWQSLNSPLQPAAYLALEPVPIPSTQIRRAPPVRELRVSAKRKEGDE